MIPIGAIGGSPFGGVDAIKFYKSQPGLEVLNGGGTQAAGATQGGGFTAMLHDKLGAAMKIDSQGTAAAQAIATGTASDISAATVAVQKAAITEQLVAGIRNKAIEAYQDVMRMQV